MGALQTPNCATLFLPALAQLRTDSAVEYFFRAPSLADTACSSTDIASLDFVFPAMIAVGVTAQESAATVSDLDGSGLGGGTTASRKCSSCFGYFMAAIFESSFIKSSCTTPSSEAFCGPNDAVTYNGVVV